MNNSMLMIIVCNFETVDVINQNNMVLWDLMGLTEHMGVMLENACAQLSPTIGGDRDYQPAEGHKNASLSFLVCC